MTCDRCAGKYRCGSHRRKGPGATFSKPFTVKMRRCHIPILKETAREAGYRTASAWARAVLLQRCGLGSEVLV